MKIYKNFCAGQKALGWFWIGYQNDETDRCLYIHFLPRKSDWFWGYHPEKTLFYDCVYYKQFYFGPFFAITWSSYNE